MKKFAFLALLVCGLIASLFVRSSVSQDDSAQLKVPALNLDTVEDAKTPLRKELLELTQKRVETMTEDELKAELARMQKQLAEYNAKEKLKQAEQILNEIVKEFPETPAAIQASQMLNVQSDPFAAPTAFQEDGFRLKNPDPGPEFSPIKKK